MTGRASPTGGPTATSTTRHDPGDGDPLWYKDAVIYQAHVRSFADSNEDGIGDLPGLIDRLDHLVELGVTALWLLPFYPSPLRDDGYDIADYLGVHPDYGTLDDVRRLVEEAHRRGLRLITELVVNHTSDQHPWFRRARHAPPGSPERDFYVWSDTPERYADARIIFQDVETSNWTWDPIAGQYYWHRFYSHQPDLNFENPAVREAIVKVLDFWLGIGVDGLRLDAVPYLYEREGTMCENLPETHAELKRLRRHVDERWPGRMLLAEANQWPEDAVAYFGDGDECHMAFHFPIMPRLYMALAQGDAEPIVDIWEQTPPIPETAQWALFLRNHDELTLEMVTDEERAFMWRTYAPRPRARLNLGIRRRLAPLVDGDRRRLELLDVLLLTLPGTPVLYYGDEIAMGDDIWLDDRDGVRTPMQWTPDRNAGFSRTDPQQLDLPVITDPRFHHLAVNVETHTSTDGPRVSRTSLLARTRRMLDVRSRSSVYGRGDHRFLPTGDPAVLAYVRVLDGEPPVLVVVNVSDRPHQILLDPADLPPAPDGFVDLLDGGRLPPPTGDRGYPLTLGPYGYLWLSPRPAAPSTTTGIADLRTLLRSPRLGQALEAHLAKAPWALPSGAPARVEIEEAYPVAVRSDDDGTGQPGQPAFLAIVTAARAEQEPTRHLVVLAETTGTSADGTYVVALSSGHVVDRGDDPDLARALLRLAAEGARIRADGRELVGEATDVERDTAPAFIGHDDGESVFSDGTVRLRLLRQPDRGIHPDVEARSRLADDAPVLDLLGVVTVVRPRDDDEVVAIVDRMPPHTGTDVATALRSAPHDVADALGRFLGELHMAMAEAFAPLPLPSLARRSIAQTLRSHARRALREVRRAAPTGPSLRNLNARADELADLGRFLLDGDIGGRRIRLHGDPRPGRLWWTDGRVIALDLAGDRHRRIADRRIPEPPTRDLADLVWAIERDLPGLPLGDLRQVQHTILAAATDAIDMALVPADPRLLAAYVVDRGLRDIGRLVTADEDEAERLAAALLRWLDAPPLP